MFSVCGYDARVLIDPGSTCSFMSYDFALHVHGKIEPLGMIFMCLCLLGVLQL